MQIFVPVQAVDNVDKLHTDTVMRIVEVTFKVDTDKRNIMSRLLLEGFGKSTTTEYSTYTGLREYSNEISRP